MTRSPARLRSKTLAAWIAIVGGALGLHRFYLRGLHDVWGWLYPLPTLLGWLGVQRALQFGQDDRLSWALIPLLGLTLSAAMLTAIVYALTPDARWDERFNGGVASRPGGWAVIIAAGFALLVGAGTLMATVAFSSQRYFEYVAAPAG